MLALGALLALAGGMQGAGLDLPADAGDWNTVRDLQNKALGEPLLPPEPGSQGSLLMGAAELGAQVMDQDAGKLQSADYNALFALLQRYRDELVGMGLDYDKLLRRLDDLKAKSADLKNRLDNLHPKDGAKIHGRAITTYSDSHLTGNRAITLPSFSNKPAKDGLRFQQGVSRAEVVFEATKGMLSALSELNALVVWGGKGTMFEFRRFYIEVRSPVAFQFGHINTNLTPLTLWRNEDPNPFEPEPFKSRRERLRGDMQLVPDKLRIMGMRASTDLFLFNTVDLDLESVTALVALPFAPGSNLLPQESVYSLRLNAAPTVAMNYGLPLNTTYMQGWRANLRTSFGLDLGYQGSLFFDDPQNRPNSGFRPMLETVHSARAKFEKGIFFADAEYAMSSYEAPARVTTPQAGLLTGTAMLVNAGIRGGWGQVKAYGRAAGSGFHAAGAQMRTQDANYEFLTPLLTEVSQMNGTGGFGMVTQGLPPDAGPIWNGILLPPGVVIYKTTPAAQIGYHYAGVFSHLLPYNYLNEVAPYGMASPNRQGYGLDADLKFFDGVLKVKAIYDSANHVEAVSVSPTSALWQTANIASTITAKPAANAFTFTRMGVGAEVNFKLLLPVTVSGGYTMNESKNGQNSWVRDTPTSAFIPFGITSTLLQAGLAVKPNDAVTVAVGMQSLAAKGFSDQVVVLDRKGTTYDQFAYSVFWTISDITRIDLLYENLIVRTPETLLGDYQVDSGLIRFQMLY